MSLTEPSSAPPSLVLRTSSNKGLFHVRSRHSGRSTISIPTRPRKDLRLVRFEDGTAGRVDLETGEIREMLSVEDVQYLDFIYARRGARRAVTEMMEFAIYHALVKMWTLTYIVEPSTPQEIQVDVARLWRWMKDRYGDRPMYYVVEKGAEFGRIHVHLVTQDFFIDKHALQRAWGKGLVEFTRKRRADGQEITDAETLAHYLAKDLGLYLAKDFEMTDGVRHFRGHRYHRTRGESVPEDLGDFSTYDAAMAFIEERRGRVVCVWTSMEQTNIDMPPVWLLLDESRYSARRRGGSP